MWFPRYPGTDSGDQHQLRCRGALTREESLPFWHSKARISHRFACDSFAQPCSVLFFSFVLIATSVKDFPSLQNGLLSPCQQSCLLGAHPKCQKMSAQFGSTEWFRSEYTTAYPHPEFKCSIIPRGRITIRLAREIYGADCAEERMLFIRRRQLLPKAGRCRLAMPHPRRDDFSRVSSINGPAVETHHEHNSVEEQDSNRKAEKYHKERMQQWHPWCRLANLRYPRAP